MASKTKTVNGKEYTASDFAYVPDPDKPSTWKLPIFDERHAGEALAALDKDFRGNQAEIPAKDHAEVKRKIEAAHRKYAKK